MRNPEGRPSRVNAGASRSSSGTNASGRAGGTKGGTAERVRSNSDTGHPRERRERRSRCYSTLDRAPTPGLKPRPTVPASETQGLRKKFGDEIVVERTKRRQVRLRVALRVQIVSIERLHPRQHLAIAIVGEMLVRAFLVPRVERVVAQRVERLDRQAVLHDVEDVLVVT